MEWPTSTTILMVGTLWAPGSLHLWKVISHLGLDARAPFELWAIAHSMEEWPPLSVHLHLFVWETVPEVPIPHKRVGSAHCWSEGSGGQAGGVQAAVGSGNFNAASWMGSYAGGIWTSLLLWRLCLCASHSKSSCKGQEHARSIPTGDLDSFVHFIYEGLKT